MQITVNLPRSFFLKGSFLGISIVIITSSFSCHFYFLGSKSFMKLANLENFLGFASCLGLDKLESTFSSSSSMHGLIWLSMVSTLLGSNWFSMDASSISIVSLLVLLFDFVLPRYLNRLDISWVPLHHTQLLTIFLRLDQFLWWSVSLILYGLLLTWFSLLTP